MKRRWAKTAFLFFLMMMVCNCATAPRGEMSDKDNLDKSDEKRIKKMAREIAKDRTTDFYQKGMTEFNEGDFKSAVISLKKAVNENRNDTKALYALGQSFEKLNKTKEAEAAYEEAVRIKSDYLPAREALGLLYFHQKKFQEAKMHLKEAGTLKSEVAEVYYFLGEIEQRENACRTAITAYRQAIELNSNYLAARNGLKVTEEACRQEQLQQQKQTREPQQRQQLSQPPTTTMPR